MTLEEKFGQLFVLLKAIPCVDEEKIKAGLTQSHQGGLRWQGGDMDTVYLQNTAYQKHSKLPLLVAANCDDGGSGVSAQRNLCCHSGRVRRRQQHRKRISPGSGCRTRGFGCRKIAPMVQP